MAITQEIVILVLMMYLSSNVVVLQKNRDNNACILVCGYLDLSYF